MYLPTVGQRWLKVIKPTVILSTSAHRQLQTSIVRAFADIGPTLAQGKKANSHFVNVSPPSATYVYPPCICRHWANVGSRWESQLLFCQRQPTVSYRRLSSLYLPTLGQRWLEVKKPTVFFASHITDMIVLVLYFSHKINIIMGTQFTELSNIVRLYIFLTKSCDIAIQSWSDNAKNIQQYWIVCPW